MRLIVVILCVFVGVSGCGSAPVKIDPNSDFSTDARFSPKIDFSNPNYELMSEAIFHATNETRLAKGRPEVTFNATLATAAQRYAKRQATKNFLAHEDPTGGPRTPKDRAIKAGAKNPFIAENLATAAGYPIDSGEKIYVRQDGSLSRAPDGPSIKRHTYRSFARDIVNAWMNSPGHRKNLLSKDALELGCGAHIFYQGDVASFVGVQKFQLYERLK